MDFNDPIASFWHDWIYSALFLTAALSIIAYTNWEKRRAAALEAEEETDGDEADAAEAAAD